MIKYSYLGVIIGVTSPRCYNKCPEIIHREKRFILLKVWRSPCVNGSFCSILWQVARHGGSGVCNQGKLLCSSPRTGCIFQNPLMTHSSDLRTSYKAPCPKDTQHPGREPAWGSTHGTEGAFNIQMMAVMKVSLHCTKLPARGLKGSEACVPPTILMWGSCPVQVRSSLRKVP